MMDNSVSVHTTKAPAQAAIYVFSCTVSVVAAPLALGNPWYTTRSYLKNGLCYVAVGNTMEIPEVQRRGPSSAMGVPERARTGTWICCLFLTSSLPGNPRKCRAWYYRSSSRSSALVRDSTKAITSPQPAFTAIRWFASHTRRPMESLAGGLPRPATQHW